MKLLKSLLFTINRNYSGVEKYIGKNFFSLYPKQEFIERYVLNISNTWAIILIDN